MFAEILRFFRLGIDEVRMTVNDILRAVLWLVINTVIVMTVRWVTESFKVAFVFASILSFWSLPVLFDVRRVLVILGLGEFSDLSGAFPKEKGLKNPFVNSYVSFAVQFWMLNVFFCWLSAIMPIERTPFAVFLLPFVFFVLIFCFCLKIHDWPWVRNIAWVVLVAISASFVIYTGGEFFPQLKVYSPLHGVSDHFLTADQADIVGEIQEVDELNRNDEIQKKLSEILAKKKIGTPLNLDEEKFLEQVRSGQKMTMEEVGRRGDKSYHFEFWHAFVGVVLITFLLSRKSISLLTFGGGSSSPPPAPKPAGEKSLRGLFFGLLKFVFWLFIVVFISWAVYKGWTNFEVGDKILVFMKGFF